MRNKILSTLVTLTIIIFLIVSGTASSDENQNNGGCQNDGYGYGIGNCLKSVYGSGYMTTNQWNISVPVNSSYNITTPVNETATFGFSVNNNNGTTTGFITYQQIGLNTRTNIFGNVTSSNIDIVNKTVSFSGIATVNGIGSYLYTASVNDNVNFGIDIPLLNYTVEPDTNINYGVVIYKQN